MIIKRNNIFWILILVSLCLVSNNNLNLSSEALKINKKILITPPIIIAIVSSLSVYYNIILNKQKLINPSKNSDFKIMPQKLIPKSPSIYKKFTESVLPKLDFLLIKNKATELLNRKSQSTAKLCSIIKKEGDYFTFKYKDKKISITYGSIIKMDENYSIGKHAITNAANENLAVGGGVDGIIHSEIYKFSPGFWTKKGSGHRLETGNAEVGVLPKEFIEKTKIEELIHAVAPYGNNNDRIQKIKNVYKNTIKASNSKTLVVPSLGTGIYEGDVFEYAPYVAEAIKEAIDDDLFKNVNHFLITTFCSGYSKKISDYEDFTAYSLGFISVLPDIEFTTNIKEIVNVFPNIKYSDDRLCSQLIN